MKVPPSTKAIFKLAWDSAINSGRKVIETSDLLKAVWRNIRMGEGQVIQVGTHRVRVHAEFRVTVAYFQAVAKIAFHYYLVHSRRRYRGDECHFAGIRDFIMNGGDKDRFFRASGRLFKQPFGKTRFGTVTPDKWCHFLAADETQDLAVAYVRLFVGPRALPPDHYVTLGNIESTVVVPSFVWGHVYQYDRGVRSRRFCGRVVEGALTRFRRA